MEPGRNEAFKLIEEAESLRRNLLGGTKSRDDVLKVLLELASREIVIASQYIDCPYCRKHMLLESSEIRRVLERISREGNTRHRHGIRERLRGLVVSLKIFFYVILGGLRRAGLI